MEPQNRARVKRLDHDFPISFLDNENWNKAPRIPITSYWSGDHAPKGRHFHARLLWSDSAFYFRFKANRQEPLVVSEQPDLTAKTIGLWDRDVCEIFIAPNRADRNRYFEFEIAPTGEWVDLDIRVSAGKRETDLDYLSGMQSAVRVDEDQIVMAIKIGWTAFGRTPVASDVWLGNLFRCVGSGLTRGYLAWQPTNTPEPNFHVPDAFGEFLFEE